MIIIKKGEHMKMKLLKSEQGFSLVELMVVVAIIGILATIGIPQYQKFMAKARQAEAKTHLNAIFQGEASHFTEYNTYSGNLQAIGAGAVGQDLRYNAGFRNGVACVGASALTPASTDGNNDLISVSTGGGAWRYAGKIADLGGTTDCSALATGYIAAAWGNPTNAADGNDNNKDVFTINQNRLLTQTAVGL